MCPAVRQQCFAMSSLRAGHNQIALLLVVKINTSVYILSQLQNNRRDSGCVSIFNDNVPTAVHVGLFV